MRWIIILVACAALAAAAEAPRGLRLEGHALAPARVTAAWLGAALTAEADGRLTLTRGDTTLCAAFTRRAATRNGADITFPAPALRVHGTGYLPARALAEAFGATVAWDATTHTLTLTRPEAPPLVLPTTPLPRPACLTDDTLAGLTIGDHLAQAVLRWGDYTAADDGAIPGTREYIFPLEAKGGLRLLVLARDEELLLVNVALTEEVAPADLPAALRTVGTSSGWRLLGEMPARDAGNARTDYSHYSEDTVIVNFPRGPLTLITVATFIGNRAGTTQLTLVRRGFPKKGLPLYGPL